MKIFLFLGLTILLSQFAHAEVRSIGVRVTRDADSKIYVAIASDVAKEQKSKITVEQAANILREVEWDASVTVGIVAHGIGLQDYFPLIKAISENMILSLAFVEGATPPFTYESIKRKIEHAATSDGDKPSN